MKSRLNSHIMSENCVGKNFRSTEKQVPLTSSFLNVSSKSRVNRNIDYKIAVDLSTSAVKISSKDLWQSSDRTLILKFPSSVDRPVCLVMLLFYGYFTSPLMVNQRP